VWLSPDAFGFLFWETKENWSLYRANRPSRLKPVVIGRHGEKMRQLLVPGFHSGTLPKLFRRLRRAEREAYKTGIWRTARTYRHDLQEVEKSLRQFVERELLALVHQGSRWHHHPMSVGKVALASQQVSIELCHADYPTTPLRLVFAEQAGRVVAGIEQAGWLQELPPPQFRELTTALAGLYKLAGVDLVREQIRANLPPEITAYDITRKGLVLHLDPRNGAEAVFDIDDDQGLLQPHTLAGKWGEAQPVLDARQVIFARLPLTWQRWVENWQPGGDSEDNAQLSRVVVGQLASPMTEGAAQSSPEESPLHTASTAFDAAPAGEACRATPEASLASQVGTGSCPAPEPPSTCLNPASSPEASSPPEPRPLESRAGSVS
jgi:hypothetical protein